jgi:hypothetical protein
MIDNMGYDQGYVQIKVGAGDWKTIGSSFSGGSPVWTQTCVDLSAYADSTVRIAFYFTSIFGAVAAGWYIDDVRIEGVTMDVNEPGLGVSHYFALHQSYPNPFNPLCTIRYDISSACRASLKVFHVNGSVVRTLVDGWREPGVYSEVWDGRSGDGSVLPSGVYFYCCDAQNGAFKMTLSRRLY